MTSLAGRNFGAVHADFAADLQALRRKMKAMARIWYSECLSFNIAYTGAWL